MLFAEIQQQRARAGVPGTKGKAATTMSEAHPSHPSSLPANWIWTQLGDVLLKLTDGTHHSPPNLPSGDFLYVSAKNIKQHGVSLHSVSYVTAAEHRDIFARCNPTKGDVLYVKDGATTGVVTINDLDEPFSMLSSVALLKVPKGIYNRLLVAFLRSPFFYDQMRGFMKGAALPRVTLKRMAPAVLPLPPLAEQHRIVAKVDELLAVCDQLGAAQAERERRRDRLRASSLVQLTSTQGVTPESSKNRGTLLFIQQSDRVLTSPTHLVDVRHAIMDLAVQGRVTEHDPGAWADETLASACDLIIDGDHNPPPRQPNGIPYLTAKNVAGGVISLTGCTYVSEGDYLARLKRYNPQPGDVLLTCVGSLGRTAVVPAGLRFSADRNLAALRPNRNICTSAYLTLVLESPKVQANLTTISGQTAQPHIYLKDIRAQGLRIPPLAEQRRIVAKVDELMAVCDELERALTAVQTGRARALEAVLAEALEGALPIRGPELLATR